MRCRHIATHLRAVSNTLFRHLYYLLSTPVLIDRYTEMLPQPPIKPVNIGVIETFDRYATQHDEAAPILEFLQDTSDAGCQLR